MNPTESNLAGFGEFLKNHLTTGFELKTIGAKEGGAPITALVVPDGLTVKSVKALLDEYRERPERREGIAVMQDLESFIGHVNRFKDADTALFANADRNAPSLLAVLDYHERVNVVINVAGEEDSAPEFRPGALPRFGKHRTLYQFPLSREWKAWQEKNSKAMTQIEFAAFLEERGIDILPPPTFEEPLSDADARLKKVSDLLRGRFAGPEQMMDLSRGLAIYESAKVIAATNLSSGEGAVTFETEHNDGNGEKLQVPNLFCIGIPVFEHGDLYRVLVRLRYRKNGGALNWFYDLYRADTVFDDALKQACVKAREATDLPLFVGKPEGSNSN
ncbi:DUF2303 family protein [Azospirillum sp.]|uniref:DUF2303 family protein n=1 Tax=Azospirillum sp. TaxID=34012 RepID=UPI003D734557